jgi:hypothetical protein
VAQERLPSAEHISRTLADILGEPEFESFEAGLLNRLLARLGTRFRDWIDRIFPDIPQSEAEFVTAFLMAIGIAAAGYAVWKLLPAANPRAGRTDAEDIPDDLRSAGDWLRLASRSARAREYGHAATALYQGVVLTLERRGAVAFHPSKTPGEYALEATGGMAIDEAEKADAASFISAFQKLAFGHRPPSAAGYRGLKELAGRTGCALPERDRK